jgi:hypothetical protein
MNEGELGEQGEDAEGFRLRGNNILLSTGLRVTWGKAKL